MTYTIVQSGVWLILVNDTTRKEFGWFRRLDDARLVKRFLENETGFAQINARLDKLFTQGETIMSAISDFADKMNTHNAAVDAAIDGLTGDVALLTQMVADLQASQGMVTPEDQALLDGIEAKAKTVADKLAALDALTPPPAPPG